MQSPSDASKNMTYRHYPNHFPFPPDTFSKMETELYPLAIPSSRCVFSIGEKGAQCVCELVYFLLMPKGGTTNGHMGDGECG